MSLHLHECIFTQNDCYLADKYINPSGIMLHSTGANNPWLRRYVQPDDGLLGGNQYGNHWNQPSAQGEEKKCVHAWVGKIADGTVASYQTLPWDMRGWHCAGSGNNTHISFEICEDDLKDPVYFEAVYEESAQLCAYLCKLFNLTPDKICCHAEGYQMGIASNKSDVLHWFNKFGRTMKDFRNYVAKLLEPPKPAKETVAGMSDVFKTDWYADSVQYCVEKGLMIGEESNRFNPNGPVTRAQLAVVLHRLNQ